ncbi:MAG: hypothetical protein QNI93_06090 [Kiloniellales bacterium]|nr:hypothetical protein [Kiloniellales bacterium]
MGFDNMTLFKEINIWRRAGRGGLVRYRCFENLETGRFHLRNADTFDGPITQEELDARDAYFYDFLVNAFAEEPFEDHATLMDAIQAHEADFSSS